LRRSRAAALGAGSGAWPGAGTARDARGEEPDIGVTLRAAPGTVPLVPAAPEAFATDRLTLTRVVADDRGFLGELWNLPDVAANLGGPRAPAAVAAGTDRLVGHWATLGYGIWILRIATGPIGYCGVAPTDVGGPGGIELLYAQLPTEWGNGYVTEAVRAVMGIAFDDLGVEEVVAFTLTTNTASRAVMERTGFELEGAIEHAGLPHVLYRCSKRQP
jgi:[ribosomal protein S5]-alanine N-acetyltransferase